jgi:hypothetical protein
MDGIVRVIKLKARTPKKVVAALIASLEYHKKLLSVEPSGDLVTFWENEMDMAAFFIANSKCKFKPSAERGQG